MSLEVTAIPAKDGWNQYGLNSQESMQHCPQPLCWDVQWSLGRWPEFVYMALLGGPKLGKT